MKAANQQPILRFPFRVVLCGTILLCVVSANSVTVKPSDDWRSALVSAESESIISFLPGTYEGGCGIDLNQSVVLNSLAGPAGTVIDCGGRDRLFHIRGPMVNVTVRGFTIQHGQSIDGHGGGCIFIEGAAQVSFEDSLFTGCSSNNTGGAIQAVESTLELMKVTFADNHAASSGGAVAIINGSASVTDSSFVSCTAGWSGGAVHLLRSSTVEMSETRINFCFAGYGGGGVFVEEDSALRAAGRVSITNNSVFGVGGGIWATGQSVVEVSGSSEILANSAKTGGGVAVSSDSMLTAFSEVLIGLNDAEMAAGIGALGLSSIHLSRGVVVTKNTATIFAGGIGTMYGFVTLENGVEISENVAGESAAGVAGEFFSSTILSEGVVITKNFAHILTGGLGVGSYSTCVMFGRVSITDNVAEYQAGGLGFREFSHAQIYSGVDIRANTAMWGCGGIYVNYDSILEVSGNVSIAENSAPLKAGGIMARFNSHVVLSDGVLLRGNRVTGDANVNFGTEGYGAVGGGIALYDGGTLNASNVSFLDNIASGTGMDGFGGALYAESDSKCDVVQCTFLSNSASNSGGAIHLVSVRIASFCLCTLHSNTAARLGGSIGAVSSVFSIVSSELHDNYAGTDGGSIGALSSSFSVVSSELHNNYAETDGGCISLQGLSTGVISDSAFSGCVSQGRGGGIASLDQSLLNLQDRVLLRNNTAFSVGGAIFVGGSGGLTFLGSILELRGNSAEAGGAISFQTPIKLLEGMTVVRSNSAREGGGIHGTGAAAELHIAVGHSLQVQNNTAEFDGGGIALRGGRISFESLSSQCPDQCIATIGDGYCNLNCFSLECGWDGGDCSERFEVAGPDAALSCKREQNGDGRDVCGPGLFSELALSECAQECVVASCDWSLTNVYCQRALNQLVDCPLFDAAVYQSVVNQSGLVFVKEGGTARGLGRCKNASCSSAHPPPMPAWCTEPACQVNNTSETEWCETVDDGGRVLEMGCEVVCTITVDIGQSWGLCSRNRPRLPVSGFNFDADKLRRVAEISIDAVFREYPGCGTVPLEIRSNRAGRNGGGLFKSENCDQAQGGCVFMPLDSSSMIIVQHNSALNGGGLHTECTAVGACGKKHTLPLHLSQPVLSVEENEARGYGSNMASFPAQLEVMEAAPAYVPGQSFLNATLILKDALGQRLKSLSVQPLPFVISVLVCFTSSEACSMADSIQPPNYFSVTPGQSQTSIVEAKQVLLNCEVGVPGVRLIFTVLGDSFEGNPSMTQTIDAVCNPCQHAQERRESAVHDRKVWTCSSCQEGEYNPIPNDPAVKCRSCPDGATCTGGNFVPVVQESKWELEEEGGGTKALRVTECPLGSILVRRQHHPEGDTCVWCPPNTYSLAKATYQPAVMTVTEPADAVGLCRQCEPGADCPGGASIIPRVDFWMLPLDAHLEGLQASPRAQVYQCRKYACKAGGVCAARRTGPTCGQCEEGSALAGTRCVECGMLKNRGMYYAVCALVGLALLVLYYLAAWRPFFEPEDEVREEETEEQTSSKGIKQKLKDFAAVHKHKTEYMKIAVAFFQVMSTFESYYNTEWPEEVERVWEIGSFARLSLIDIPGPNCVLADLGYLSRLQIITTLPILVSFMLYLPVLALIICGKTSTNHFKRVRDRFWQLVMIVMFLMFPTLSIETVRGFKCTKIGNENLLDADLSLSCPVDNKTSAIFIWSLVSTILFPFGIPLFMLWTFRWFRIHELAEAKKTQAVLNAMLAKYKELNANSISAKLGIYIGGSSSWVDERMDLLAKQLVADATHNGSVALACNQLVDFLATLGISASHVEVAEMLAAMDLKAQGVCDSSELLGLFRSIAQREKLFHVPMNPTDVPDQVLEELTQIPWSKLLARGPAAQAQARHKVQRTGRVARHESTATLQEVFSRTSSFRRAASTSAFSRTSSQDSSVPVRLDPNPSDRRTDVGKALNSVSQAGETTREHKVEALRVTGCKLLHRRMLAMPAVTWGHNATPEELAVLDRLGFLFGSYRVEFWYWELVEIARKLIMTSIILFLLPGSPEQLAIAVLTTAWALVYVLAARPYADVSIGHMQAALLSAQTATLFYGLMLCFDKMRDQLEEADVYSRVGSAILLVFLSTVIFIIPPLFFLFEKRQSLFSLLRNLCTVRPPLQQEALADMDTEPRDDNRGFTPAILIARDAGLDRTEEGLGALGPGGGVWSGSDGGQLEQEELETGWRRLEVERLNESMVQQDEGGQPERIEQRNECEEQQIERRNKWEKRNAGDAKMTENVPPVTIADIVHVDTTLTGRNQRQDRRTSGQLQAVPDPPLACFMQLSPQPLHAPQATEAVLGPLHPDLAAAAP